MKRILVLLCLFALLTACQQDDTTPVTPTENSPAETDAPVVEAQNTPAPLDLVDMGLGLNNGLVAIYEFNGNLGDGTGLGEEMIIHGAEETQNQYDVMGAYAFDGTDDYAEIPDHPALALGEQATISLWVYYLPQTKSGKYYTLLEKSDPERDGHARYGLWVIDNKAEFCLEPSNGETQRCVRSTARLFPEEWNHIVGHYENGNVSVFVNGDRSGYAEFTPSPIASNNQPIFLATDRFQSDSLFFKGHLDDIRIYNRALEDNEIQVLFSGL